MFNSVQSVLFVPIAVLGAALLVLGFNAFIWVPLLVVGLGGAILPSAVGAGKDDEVRQQVTGTGRTQTDPDDTAPGA